MTNLIIQGLWVGGELSVMERLCVQSFLSQGHEFHLYAYEPVRAVPEGTRVMDARAIVPESQVFRHRSGFGAGSFAPFSDLFRYQLLWERGGWWVDMDVVCLKPFDFAAPQVVSTVWEAGNQSVAVNCVMKFPPGDPVVGYCLDDVRQQHDLAAGDYGKIGPALVARAISVLDVAYIKLPWPTFCPIRYRDVRHLVHPPEALPLRRLLRHLRGRPAIRITSDSYAVHLWNEMWRYNQMDKRHVYDPRSYYEQLKSAVLAGHDVDHEQLTGS